MVDLGKIGEMYASGAHAVEFRGLHDDSAGGGVDEGGQERHHEVVLGKDVDLHVAVYAIFGLVVDAYA